MEFLLSVWQFYLAAPMFTVGFMLGNMFFGMLYLNYYGREHWQHHPWYIVLQSKGYALLIIGIASALWPLTIHGFIIHWLWKYPCYWIGKFITDRFSNHH